MRLPPRPPWSWLGASVFALALLVGGGWATALIISTSARTPPISDTTSDLLVGIGSILAGAISTFVGASIQRRHEEHRTPENDEGE